MGWLSFLDVTGRGACTFCPVKTDVLIVSPSPSSTGLQPTGANDGRGNGPGLVHGQGGHGCGGSLVACSQRAEVAGHESLVYVQPGHSFKVLPFGLAGAMGAP